MNGKANKSEVDSLVNSKAEIKEMDRMLMALENKFESEFQNIHDQVNRKANMDDIQFYRKELNFKIDKSELEAFRQDYIEKMSMVDFKMKDKTQSLSQLKDSFEQKLEQSTTTLKSQF